MARTPKRALIVFVTALLVMQAVVVAAAIGGITIVDSVRGYVAGEGAYSKAQKNAVIALHRYLDTSLDHHYDSFLEELAVPKATGRARVALEDLDQPRSASHAPLVAGGLDAADAPGAAWLFRAFGETGLLAPALATWRQADRAVTDLEALGAALYQARRDGALSAGEHAVFRARLGRVDNALTRLQTRFSTEMGAAGRRVTWLASAGTGAIGGVLALATIGLGWRSHRKLRAAIAAVQEREACFRDVAELTADWIWECDADLRFTYFSDRLESVTGTPKEQMLGKPRWEVSDEPIDEKWCRHIADLYAHRPFHGFEYTAPDAKGLRRHRRMNGKPLFDAAGLFRGYRGTGSDITEEVEARAETARKQELLERTFEAIAQGILVLDGQHRIRAFNARFLALHGLPPDRLAVGDVLAAVLRLEREQGVLDPSLSLEDALARRLEAMAAAETQAVEQALADGRVLELRTQPLPSGGLVVTYSEITGHRQIQDALRRAKEAAEAADRAKSQLLANMSHELRTPLNAIIGFSEIMAQKRLGPIDQRYAEYAGDIHASGEHLLAVINDILDLSRIEAGHGDLKEDWIALPEIVAKGLRIMEPRAQAGGVSLVNAVAETAPALWADAQRVQQILLNLLSNACKFSAAGTQVTVRLHQEAAGLALSVADQGIGMDPAQIARVFEPFVQLDSGLSRSYEGTGLGLALVESFVALHDGTVRIDSAPGAGTTVTVMFPCNRVRGSRATGLTLVEP